MITNIQTKNNRLALLLSFLLILVIGLIDYFTGTEIAFSIFYLIPVLILALQNTIKHQHIVVNAIVASIVWFLPELIAGDYSHAAIPVWNSFVRLIIFIVVGHLAFNLNQKHQKLIETNRTLENLNSEKNKLIGMAAHDLRNPIGNIFAFSDLLITGYSDKTDPNALEIINYIKSISSNTLEMLEKLLDISKIESGTISLSFKQQEYMSFIRKYIALNQMFADKKNINIIFTPEKEEIYLSFDENYLSEVINNLLTNAIKFSYPKSDITVNIFEKKKFIKTEVTDKGKGIPVEEQKKLFQYFQKTSVKPTGGEKGTGLGLAIAKKIVMEHNGRIGVDSKPGKGSTFYYELPKEKNNNKHS